MENEKIRLNNSTMCYTMSVLLAALMLLAFNARGAEILADTDITEHNVSVEDGVATLTGAVDSWTEYNAARENAFQGGAVTVITKLRVGGF